MKTEKYEVVIGLEVHAQLLTQSKLFCGDSATFGAEPNTHVSPITLAHPGTLPKMNSQAIEYAVRLGLALNCEIATHNYFARKNYFYPDLPKGYQVTQHTTPICMGGQVKVSSHNDERMVQLNRIHMEEDAGKSLHDVDEHFTALDYNRAGVPLLEIVTEPDIFSSEEAFLFLTELRRMVRWLGVCDGNMEEGSMRCDANISIRPKGTTKLGTRVEVKNLNSIRNVKKAIDMEVDRLEEILENGGTIVQETRSFDADKEITFSMRSKEEANDYRYFPEPDLSPFHITQDFLSKAKNDLPLLPEQKMLHYKNELGLPTYDAKLLSEDKATSDYFDALTKQTTNYKAASNWMNGPVKSWLNENNQTIETFSLHPEKIADLIALVDAGQVNFGVASAKIFPVMLEATHAKALDVATRLNLLQVSDDGAIEEWVNQVLASMPDKVAEYKKGKKGLIGLFMGEVKKLSKGKADPKMTTKLLEEKLA
jgi:aspartyl-tRNA(Asn)/glutamyl-tRNA(Gln) amidotransferase subunit B